MPEITAETLHEYFDYQPTTGKIIWKKRRPGRASKAGKEAGTISKARPGCPYRVLSLFRKKLYAHRVAWMLTHGEIPDGLCIDHIDGDGLNNRIENLRLVTRTENQRNSKVPSNNSSGHMNVQHYAKGFLVQVAGKYIGYYKDITKAMSARDKAYKDMGFHPNHGRKSA